MLLALRQIVEARPSAAGAGRRQPRARCSPREVGPSYRRWYVGDGRHRQSSLPRHAAQAPAGHIYATGDVLRQVEATLPARPRSSRSQVKGKVPPRARFGCRSRRVRRRLAGDQRKATASAGRPRPTSSTLLRQAIDAASRGSRSADRTGRGDRAAASRGCSSEARDARRRHDGAPRSTCEVLTRETPYVGLARSAAPAARRRNGTTHADVCWRVCETEIARSDPELLPWLPLIAIACSTCRLPSTPRSSSLRATEAGEASRGRRSLPRSRAGRADARRGRARTPDGCRVGGAVRRRSPLSSNHRPWLMLVTRRDVAGGLELSDEPRPCGSSLARCRARTRLALAQATPSGAACPRTCVELAVERSGGSPEFLLDLLAARPAADRDELPESIGAATMARIDALDPRDGVLSGERRCSVSNFDPRRLADVLEADMQLQSTTDSGSDSRPCSRARPTAMSGSGVPPCRRWRTQSLPFKLRRQLHMSVGLRLERDQDL